MRLLCKTVIYLLLGSCAAVIALGQDKLAPAPTQPDIVLRLGHASSISAMAVSPDGQHLATASHDRTVRVWDIQSGVGLRVLQHPASVKAVAFITNTQLATGTTDGSLLIWDIQTGQPLKHAKVGSFIDQLLASPDGAQLWCAAMSAGVFALDTESLTVIANYPDDSSVAVARTAQKDGAYGVVRWPYNLTIFSSNNRAVVELWRGPVLVEAGKLFQTEKRITSAAVASDGPTVMLGTEDGMVHKLSGPELTERVSYIGHTGSVEALDIAPDGVKFASAGRTDHVVLVRNMNTGGQIRKIESSDRLLDKVLFTADSDEFLIATDEDNSARLIDLSSGKELAFRRAALPVFKVQSSRDHRYLLTGTWYRAHMWDSATGKMVRGFPLSGSAGAIAIDPDGKKVFTGESLPHDYSSYLVARDVATGKVVGRYPHKTRVTSAVYSPDRRWLATGDTTGRIHLWNTATGREVKTMTGHSDNVTVIFFGPTDDTLLSHSSDNTARVWNLETGEERWRENALGIHMDVFSPDGQLLAAWWGGSLRLFDVRTHKQLVEINDAAANFTFANSNTSLFVDERQSTLMTWNAEQGERRIVSKVRDPSTVRILPLKGTLAIICESDTATVVDWATGKAHHTFQNASCSPASVPFILVDRKDRKEVWNAITLTRQSRLPRVSKNFEHFAVSADGRFMVTTNSEALVEVWDLNLGRRLRKEADSYRRYDSIRAGLPALAANRDRYFVSLESNEAPQTAINELTLGPGTRRRSLFVQPYAITSLDVSPDGARLVTCGGDGSLRLINAGNGKVLAYKKDTGCLDAKFSRNGALITTTGLIEPGPPQVWTADLSRRLPGLDYRPTDVKHLAVSEGGETMLTVEGIRKLRLWDLTKGQEKVVLPPVGDSVSIQGVELVSDGLFAIAALDTGEIQSWQTMGGDLGRKYIGHRGPVRFIKRAQNNDQVFLSAGEDGSVRVWDVLAFKPLRVIEGLGGSISTATLSADATLLLVATSDRTVRIWDVESGRMLHTFNLQALARSAAFSPDKASVVVGSDDGVTRVIKVNSGRTDRELRLQQLEPISSAEYLGRYIVTTSRSGTTFWDESGERLNTFTTGAPVVVSRTYVDSANNVNVINAGSSIFLGHFSRFGFQRGALFVERVSSVAASPDGKRIAVGFSTGWLRIWDLVSQAMVTSIRVSDSALWKIKYSSDGRAVLISTDKDVTMEWDVASGSVARTYSGSSGVNDLAFAGAADQFVLIASDEGRVRVLDRATGMELCSLLSMRNGEWLVVRSDGLFDGTDAAPQAVSVRREGRSSAQGKPTEAVDYRHRAGLLAAILRGEIAPPVEAAGGLPVLPHGKLIRFDLVKSPDEAPPSTETRSPETSPPTGLGLQLLVKLFADLLGANDRLEVNDGNRVETLPNGRIVVGTSALAQVFKGQSFSSSIGLTAFVVAHEIWHSRQAAKYRFGELSSEDLRLLECQADVLGTIDAIKLVAAMGSSRETVEAYAAVRNSQKAVSAMSTLEAGDSSHPTQEQREWAVEFGNARFAARVVKDDIASAVLNRRFDAGRIGDDEPWAQSVCKRVLNYRLSDQGRVTISLRNERRIGGRWEGEVVYHNVSERPLRISAHVRLVGTAFSELTGTLLPKPAHIDGYLTSFTLEAGAERIESVSLAEIELPGDKFEASGILYTSSQQRNWMSVEDATSDAPPATQFPARVPEASPAAEAARATTCVQAEGIGPLTKQQRELGVFLFRAAAHASDGFLGLRSGNAITLPLPTEKGEAYYVADIRVPGGQNANITVHADGQATLNATLGTSLSQSEADDLFKKTGDHLRVLCPGSKVETRSHPAGLIGMEFLSIPEFAPGVEVRLVRMIYKRRAVSDITLSIETKRGR